MKIDKTYLFRYFRGELSDAETKELDRWVGESDGNERLFREAHAEYDYLTLYSDMDALECIEPAETARRRKFGKAVIRIFSGAAAVAVLFVLAVTVAQDRITDRLASQTVTVDVPAGQRMAVTLPDGTKVNLNSETTLTYPPLFSGKERRVSIEGEAYFDVTSDKKVPFIVETYAADVTVLGTEFNISADSDERIFSTTLIEGSVKVSDRNSEEYMVLKPDQTVIMEAGQFKIEHCRASESVRWVDGVISIGDTDFATLMKRFEKSFGVSIVIERSSMPELECAGGEVYASDGIMNALKVLQYLTDFEYRKDHATNTIYIY